MKQSNPNAGIFNQPGNKPLTTDTSQAPKVVYTAADAAKVRSLVQQQAKAVIAGKATFGPHRKGGGASP